MLGEKRLLHLASAALKHSKADQTEIVLSVVDHTLSRFANNAIHQNTQFYDATATVRAVVGKRIGVCTTNQLAGEGITRAVERAIAIAKLARSDPHFVSLPGPAKYETVTHGFVDTTAHHSPKDKASAIHTIILTAKDKNFVASGAFETSVSELAIANSLGVWAYHPATVAKLTVTIQGDTGTGYASSMNVDSERINVEKIAHTAVKKARKAQNPMECAPGDFEVILEPTAVNDLLGYFAWLGPNARIYHEDVSFMTGKLGQKLVSEHITIHEDALHQETVPLPFDFEGVPKKKVTLFQKGIAKNIVYDSYHAHKHHVVNTGHALPASSTEGAIPGHLVFEPGRRSITDMIRSVKRGLIITRFWYVNALHYKQLILTGMTRDGTFLLENGEITRPVKNLRFTQSVVDALANVLEVSSELVAQESWLGANLVPALRVDAFHFSGKTEH